MDRSSTILGLGAYIPPEVRTNDWWPKAVVEKWEMKANLNLRAEREKRAQDIHPLLLEELVKLKGDLFNGMQERRISSEEMPPSEMELAACKEALDDAQINPQQIDLFISYSLPPDRSLWPNAFKVHHELGLKNARCFSVDAICNSFITLIDVAHQYIKSGSAGKVLIAVSNKYSVMMDYNSSVSTNAGDGAVAMVLSSCPKEKGLQFSYIKNDTSLYDMLAFTRQDPLDGEVPVFDLNINHNGKIRMVMNRAKAKRLPLSLPRWGEEFYQEVFVKNDYPPNRIDLMVTNAFSVWYTPILAKIFQIPLEKCEDNILKFSNMGPTNLPMNLYTAYKKGRIKNDDTILMFSHGGGASYGGRIFNWYAR